MHRHQTIATQEQDASNRKLNVANSYAFVLSALRLKILHLAGMTICCCCRWTSLKRLGNYFSSKFATSWHSCYKFSLYREVSCKNLKWKKRKFCPTRQNILSTSHLPGLLWLDNMLLAVWVVCWGCCSFSLFFLPFPGVGIQRLVCLVWFEGWHGHKHWWSAATAAAAGSTAFMWLAVGEVFFSGKAYFLKMA